MCRSLLEKFSLLLMAQSGCDDPVVMHMELADRKAIQLDCHERAGCSWELSWRCGERESVAAAPHPKG